MQFKSTSVKETRMLARQVAEKLIKNKSRNATCITLSGNIGAGKTTFTKAFGKSLGIKKTMLSPTFVLLKRYILKNKRTLYHIDAYRIRSKKELTSLDLIPIFREPKNIVLIEWPQNIKSILPKKRTSLSFNHGIIDTERIITIPSSLL